jgi:transcriptional regulator with XRE-family HTH domain
MPTENDSTSIAVVVADNLRRLRQERNMSISELARRADIAKGSLAKLESGKGNPTIHTVAALADCLGVAPGDLLVSGSPELLRAGEGPVLQADAMEGRLIASMKGTTMEMYEITLRDGLVYTSEHPTAGAVEQLYVMSGTLKASIGSHAVELYTGDALRYSLDDRIEMVAMDGDVRAIVVFVMTAQARGGAQSSFTAPLVRDAHTSNNR